MEKECVVDRDSRWNVDDIDLSQLPPPSSHHEIENVHGRKNSNCIHQAFLNLRSIKYTEKKIILIVGFAWLRLNTYWSYTAISNLKK